VPLNAIEGTGTSPGVPSDVPEPQAVLGTLTTSAVFLVVSVRDAAGADARVLDVAADIGSLVRAVGFRQSEAGLTCVVGLGSRYWDRVRPDGARPAHLHPFRAIQGARHDAVATPGDVFFHVRANRQDLVFELTRLLMDALGDDVQVEDHTVGFRYFDSRDLLGFVDGTENPTGRDAAAAAIVGLDAEPDFAGGSYVVVQKYVHDLAAWHAMPVEEQERVIGRTKLDDVELDDDVQPSSSHVTLNTIVDEDGREHDILRDNMAFGDPSRGEYGTFFIAYADDPAVTELMLERMFVGAPPGNYDRILDVSTAVTGSLFFVPSLELLESMAEGDDPTVTSADLTRVSERGPANAEVTRPPTTGRPTTAPGHGDATTRPDDDLRIGSLREEPQ
jgi:putative iron-dependent peroxidase